MTIRVGYESHNYGAARNTYAPLGGQVRHEKLRRVPVELLPVRLRRGYDTAFLPLVPSGVDIVHLWNRVSFGRRPWGVSFEFDLPYIDRRLHPGAAQRLRQRLFDPDCRFIVPMSDHALGVFRRGLEPDDWARVEPKTTVVPPHQDELPRLHPYQPPTRNESLRLLFVGRTFFGKGGHAVLDAMTSVAEELDLHLTIVSPIEGGDYGGTPPVDVSIHDIHHKIASSPRITWHRSLTNDKVLELMQTTHLGLLPSWADTFGYTVLEFMASSVPVLTSNVQAMQQISGGVSGPTIEIPVDNERIWLGRQSGKELRRDMYWQTLDQATGQLCSELRMIRDDPSLLRSWSVAAIDRIRSHFSESKRTTALMALYERAMEA